MHAEDMDGQCVCWWGTAHEEYGSVLGTRSKIMLLYYVIRRHDSLM